MRKFIITEEDGSKRLVESMLHPCDDPPPYEASPAQVEHTKDGPVEIVPALIIDLPPLYDGPRENVVEVKNDAKGAKAMQKFTGVAEVKRENPELFKP